MTPQKWLPGFCACAVFVAFALAFGGCPTTTDPNTTGESNEPNTAEPNEPNTAEPNEPNAADPNQSTVSPTAPADEDIIFSNDNILGVFNNPTEATQFTTNRSYRVTSIRNYHWNNGQGTSGGGSIGLRAANNAPIGSWYCTSFNGQNNTPNAYWYCTPFVDIPAGTYTIEDSEPATWANNSASGDAGISIVRGIPIAEIPISDPNDANEPNEPEPNTPSEMPTEMTVGMYVEGTFTTDFHRFPFSVNPNNSGESTDTGGGSVGFGCERCEVEWTGNSFVAENDHTRITGTISADGQTVVEAYGVRKDRTRTYGGYTEAYELKLSNVPLRDCEPCAGWDGEACSKTCFGVKATEGELHQYVTSLKSVVFSLWTHTDQTQEVVRVDTVTAYDLNVQLIGEVHLSFSAELP